MINQVAIDAFIRPCGRSGCNRYGETAETALHLQRKVLYASRITEIRPF